jgi:pimeloyl-ACP methyl ester carboxylesterase
LIAGCASASAPTTQAISEDDPQLLEPDATLNIAGLGPCSDDPNRRLRLNSRHPVTVLVHGCLGSAGRFRALSQVLAFHGQQSACFSYDDRDSMIRSSRRLADAVEELAAQLASPQITIIGHSQGGLIARKALVSEQDDPIESHAPLRLVTVSAPLSGIRSARYCAIPLLRVATLGLHDLVCWFVSGDKWYEITPASDFIKEPGALGPFVERYLLVTTDEDGSCRQYDASGQCIEDDFVFTLDEQELPSVPSGTIAKVIEVRAGHVEIVGESGVTPEKLIQVLQQEGYVRPTDPSRAARFDALLTHLYGTHPPDHAR